MISVRPATIEEVPALNLLIAKSARELSREDYSAEEIESAIKYIFGVDTELINDQTYFVIEKDGEIAGCGGWSKRKTLFGGNQFFKREQSALLNPEQDAAKIRAFFIDPKFARQGLGAHLLNYCEQQAIKSGFKNFEMMATLTGVKLYTKTGYAALQNETVVLQNGIALKFIKMRKQAINLDSQNRFRY